jgi:hypothetical protein
MELIKVVKTKLNASKNVPEIPGAEVMSLTNALSRKSRHLAKNRIDISAHCPKRSYFGRKQLRLSGPLLQDQVSFSIENTFNHFFSNKTCLKSRWRSNSISRAALEDLLEISFS